MTSLQFPGRGGTALTRAGEAVTCIDFIAGYSPARTAARVLQSLPVSPPEAVSNHGHVHYCQGGHLRHQTGGLPQTLVETDMGLLLLEVE